MNNEERNTVRTTALVLLLASFARLAWESRPRPPLLPEEPVPAGLVAATREAVERERRMATPLGPRERIDLNRAPDVELARLPGVGPALAARIIENRETNGPFRAPADLRRVSGIGEATLARIAPHLDLSDPPLTSTAASSAARLTSAAELLDLNRATEEDLQALPGIGPALAARIVAHRATAGRFGTVDDLDAVSGIGPATLERLRPLVRAGP